MDRSRRQGKAERKKVSGVGKAEVGGRRCGGFGETQFGRRQTADSVASKFELMLNERCQISKPRLESQKKLHVCV